MVRGREPGSRLELGTTLFRSGLTIGPRTHGRTPRERVEDDRTSPVLS
jgi:hypothetical protein